MHSVSPSPTRIEPAAEAGTQTAEEKDAHFRRLERLWQDEVGQHLLDTPHQTPGSAAVFERQFQRVIDLLELDRPGFVVEVGCGKGHFLSQLQRQLGERAPTPVGVDVGGAVSALPGKQLIGVQADGAALPFRDASLSAVVYHGSLHHVIDYPKAIREAQRALVPGGRLLIFEPVSTRFSRLVHAILDPLGFEDYESPIDLEYKAGFRTDRILAAIRELDMPCTLSWSDFVAYPLTGCYGGGWLGRFSGLMRLLLRLEAWGERIPGVRRILGTIAWRVLVVATKPEALHAGDR